MPKRGKPSVRLNRGRTKRKDTETDTFWSDVLELNDLADVLRLAQDAEPMSDRRRLAAFILETSLPVGVPVGEVKRWNAIVDRCAGTTGREALGVYRAVIEARLATL